MLKISVIPANGLPNKYHKNILVKHCVTNVFVVKTSRETKYILELSKERHARPFSTVESFGIVI